MHAVERKVDVEAGNYAGVQVGEVLATFLLSHPPLQTHLIHSKTYPFILSQHLDHRSSANRRSNQKLELRDSLGQDADSQQQHSFQKGKELLFSPLQVEIFSFPSTDIITILDLVNLARSLR